MGVWVAAHVVVMLLFSAARLARSPVPVVVGAVLWAGTVIGFAATA